MNITKEWEIKVKKATKNLMYFIYWVNACERHWENLVIIKKLTIMGTNNLVGSHFRDHSKPSKAAPNHRAPLQIWEQTNITYSCKGAFCIPWTPEQVLHGILLIISAEDKTPLHISKRSPSIPTLVDIWENLGLCNQYILKMRYFPC